MNWIAFFSQTGSEIVNICEEINRWPDLIVTNRMDGFDKINPELTKRLLNGKQRMLMVEKKPPVHRYDEAIRDGAIVTLHGWLRIVPEQICSKYEIYNGHPGLITEHPELKGFNPQEKVFNSKLRYEKVGCVIHRVIPELDSGEVVAVSEVDNCFKSLEQLIGGLHGLSIQLWTQFLNGKL